MNKYTQQELLNIVKDGYEEIAEEFDETRKKYLWPEIIKLANQVKDGDSVLDAGCGNGRLLEAFKDKEINYLGVDSSEKLIKLAREKYKNCDLQVADYDFIIDGILELNKLPDKKFNYIFCIAVLHHLPGEDLRLRILNNLRERLKDGGKIILTVWNLWERKKFRNLILRRALFKLVGCNKMDFGDILFDWKNSRSESLSKRYYHAFSRRGLKKLIKKSGLKIIQLYKDKHNYYAIIE